MSRLEDNPLAQANEHIGAVLEILGRSLLVTEPDLNELADRTAERLKLQGVESPIPNIIRKASKQADDIYEYLRTDIVGVDGKSGGKSKYHGMLRRAVTLRDSLYQTADLLEGIELEEPPEREFPLPHHVQGDADDERELVMAEVFKTLKSIEQQARGVPLRFVDTNMEDVLESLAKNARYGQEIITGDKKVGYDG